MGKSINSVSEKHNTVWDCTIHSIKIQIVKRKIAKPYL